MMYQTKKHPGAGYVEVVQGCKELGLRPANHGHVHVVDAALRAGDGFIREPYAKTQIRHDDSGPTAPRPLAPVVTEHRLVGDARQGCARDSV